MKAYELIDKPSKWVDHPPSREGTYCVVTAITAVYGDSPWPVEIMARVEKHIEQEFHFLDGIVEWNDGSNWKTVYGTLKELDI